MAVRAFLNWSLQEGPTGRCRRSWGYVPLKGTLLGSGPSEVAKIKN